jgi:lipoprotein-anchoring transpeptidase ErfK/SrfK
MEALAMANAAISGIKPTTTTQPTPAQAAPAKPKKPVAPENNPNRWRVPDRALIDPRIGTVPDADKKNYKLVADLVKSRLYVVDKTTNEPVDAYLVSPGTKDHPTVGNKFTIKRVMPMSWWNPPASDWAKTAKPTPPGLNNPMGVLKLDMGGNAQYIHGTLKSNEKRLGTPASHGCIRMSNGNVIDLYQKYATVGTVVEINRDKTKSLKLDSAMAVAGVTITPLDEGNEWIDDVIEAAGPNQ